MRAVTHNVWVGQRPRAVRANLLELLDATCDPHVLALQEAKRYTGTLPGYVRVAASDERGDEAGSCVLLVREDVTIRRTPTLEVGGPSWTGPKHGRVHPPRVYPGAVLELEGHVWETLVVHRAPGGPWGRNRAAWRAEHEALLGWSLRRQERRPHRPLVMLGDWNGRKKEDRPYGVPDLAEQAGARLLLRGIDGGVVRGCRGFAHKLPDRYGSDSHRPVVLDLLANHC